VHLLQCLPALWAVMLEQFLRAVTPCEGWYSMLEQHAQHATAIPSRKYPFSSDQGSQTGLGSTSTRLSDHPGTLTAVVFMHKPHNILLQLYLPTAWWACFAGWQYTMGPNSRYCCPPTCCSSICSWQGLPCTHSLSGPTLQQGFDGFWLKGLKACFLHIISHAISLIPASIALWSC